MINPYINMIGAHALAQESGLASELICQVRGVEPSVQNLSGRPAAHIEARQPGQYLTTSGCARR
jgi:hypothetical protein